MNSNYYVAIMAGGIGSRFWPVSRTNFPKQFIDILGTGESLIQSTYKRFAEVVPEENIFVVTSEEYGTLVSQQLPTIKVENILTEPMRKNTAPCVAYVSYKLKSLNPNACLICAPSDHLIIDNTNFKKTVLEAFSFVNKNNALITLGIKPTHPNTGYGYIQYEQEAVNDNTYKVKTFTEKPNLELAKTFVASGDFLWNAGIFVWHVNNICKAFENYLPEMHELFANDKGALNSFNEQGFIKEIYPMCANISIDYGIMEKAQNVYCIPSVFGWSDLGTWNSAYENLDKDYFANAVNGDNVMIIDAKNCMIHANNKKLVLVQGIEDFIVIDTDDVLMICKREKEQEIKEYVAEVKRNKGDLFL
jgi:mannose-1-phosphate guanylyltransferase